MRGFFDATRWLERVIRAEEALEEAIPADVVVAVDGEAATLVDAGLDLKSESTVFV